MARGTVFQEMGPVPELVSKPVISLKKYGGATAERAMSQKKRGAAPLS